MDHLPSMEENPILRWGGLAGILGGVLFMLVFVVVGVFIGPDPAAPAEVVTRFPDIRAARTVEDGLYLVVMILWVTHFLALHHALRRANPAAALFGSVLSIVGLVLLAAGALPHVVMIPLSALYHAPGTPADQATVVLAWQVTQGLFNALLVAGLTFMPIGLLALGVAMLGTPTFGKGFGGVTIVLGVAGAVSAVVLLADPSSPIAVVGIFALIAFHLVLGWRVYRLSRVLLRSDRADDAAMLPSLRSAEIG